MSVVLTYTGLALSACAALLFGATVLFGDKLIKTDDQLQAAMDAIMWCLVLGLLALSVNVVLLHR